MSENLASHQQQAVSTATMSTTTTMCQTYNVPVYVITSKSDIENNPEFDTKLNQFLADVYGAIPANDKNIPSSSSSPSSSSFKAIGIDVEWGEKETPAVIQVSSKTMCFVVVVSKDVTLLEPFRAILKDKEVVKAGVGVRADKMKIEMINNYEVHGECDLAALCCRVPEANQIQSLSLARITFFYCQFQLNKDLSIVCSNWAADELSKEQLAYAADDALAGLLAFEAVMKKHINAGTTKSLLTGGGDGDSVVASPLVAVASSGTVDPTSALLAPSSPSAFYAKNDSGNDGDVNSNSSSPQLLPSTSTSPAAAAAAVVVVARVNRTPIEWAKKYIKRKVILKQPKSMNNINNNNKNKKNNNSSNVDGDISTDGTVEGVVARFESKTERRYQTVSETQESLVRIASSGVKAIGPDGNDLFHLDLAKALWYVSKKIATPLEYVDGDATKPLRLIQLNFTPTIKTKVCRTWHITKGKCSLGDSCPFAHGKEELRENIKEITDGINESLTARQLIDAGLRTRCDMCRAQNAGIAQLPVVPKPWIRLMGSEIAGETGCSVGLQLCCKCQALLRSINISERRLLRSEAAEFFISNGLLFHLKKEDEDSDEESSSSSDEVAEAEAEEEEEENESSSDEKQNNDDFENENEKFEKIKKKRKNQRRRKNKRNRHSYNKRAPQPESDLLAKINEASMTRMCSLCQLLRSNKRLTEIPPDRMKQIIERVNVFYDMLVKEGILLGKVSPLDLIEEQQQQQQEEETITTKDLLLQRKKLRAEMIADQMNQFSKSDWLASAEARDIARFFVLRPIDQREREANIVSKEEERKFIIGMKEKILESKSMDCLRVAEPRFALFWAKRMFEYYRTIFELQLRPVVIPWLGYVKNPPPPSSLSAAAVSS